MNRLNHFSWSFALSLWIYSYLFNIDILISITYSFITAFLSFLPDIDIRIINNVNKFNKKTFYLLYPITFIFKIVFKHRTITHAIWIPLILIFVSENILINIGLIWVLRIIYISLLLHIFEDTFTISGIQLFYPLGFKIRLFKFSTSSKIDFYTLEFSSYIIIFIFFFINYNLLLNYFF